MHSLNAPALQGTNGLHIIFSESDKNGQQSPHIIKLSTDIQSHSVKQMQINSLSQETDAIVFVLQLTEKVNMYTHPVNCKKN